MCVEGVSREICCFEIDCGKENCPRNSRHSKTAARSRCGDRRKITERTIHRKKRREGGERGDQERKWDTNVVANV
jgi:hypothetical protein